MNPPRTVRHCGFTLIELLVVVALLSSVSLLAFGIFAEDRTQIRYDDTRARLQVLRRAVLGLNGPPGGETPGGFVADNGALPTDLATLLQAGSLATRGVKSPVFDPKPDDTNCANDGTGETTIADAAAQLIKGHAGDYLGGLAFNGRYRDGWGNVSASDDALNFGWQTAYDSAARALSITSLGLDNAAGGSDYAVDVGLGIAANDWLIPLGGWTVQLKNARATDISANTLSLSLLVFANDAIGGKWLRYSTVALPACPVGATCGLAFTDGCTPGESVAGKGRIPQGRHLLVLVDNGADGTPWTNGDTPTTTFVQIDAIAGRNLPAVTLEIR